MIWYTMNMISCSRQQQAGRQAATGREAGSSSEQQAAGSRQQYYDSRGHCRCDWWKGRGGDGRGRRRIIEEYAGIVLQQCSNILIA